MLNSSENSRYVFTLIHGTRLLWTEKASWCQDNSPLCLRLREKFPGCKIRRFGWSGKNSVRARIKAAEELHANLQDAIQDNGEAQHFILAHSHGGNIACYALRDACKLQQHIKGIICLSTPFVHVRKREDGLSKYQSALVSAPIMGLIYLCWFFLLRRFGPLNPTEDLMSFWLGFFLVFFLSMWAGHMLSKSLDRKYSYIEARTKLLPLPLTSLLLVRVAGDEASIALLICQTAGWILNKFLAVLVFPQWMWRQVSQLIRKGPVAAVLAIVFTTYVIGGVLWFPIWILFTGILMLPIMIMAWILMIPISGHSLAGAFLFLDMAVESAPPGYHSILQFGLRGDLKEKIRTLLNHSIAYQNREIIDSIVTWVERLKESDAGRPAIDRAIACRPLEGG